MLSRVCKTICVALLCTVYVGNAIAQDSGPKTYRILGLSVEGHITSDPAMVIATSGLRIGDQITLPGDQTQKAITRLWTMKMFSDVQIVVSKETPDGIYLTIRVKEYPRLESVIVNGNDELSEDDVRSKVSLIRGQIIRPQILSKIVRALKKEYQEKGYLLAEIKPEIVPVEEGRNRANLVITIDEGPEVEIASITFSGNKAFDDDELRSAMDETDQKKWWKFWGSARFDRQAFKKDKQLVIDFYREHGYRDAEILSDSIWYDESGENMYINIRVNEGPQYFVRNIIWQGNSVYNDSVLVERLGFKRGDVYDKKTFDANLRGNQEQSDVASLYLNNGYLGFNAEVEERRIAADSLDLVISIREAHQFRIGHVYLKGNNKTRDKVIRRVLYTRPGDYFSRAAIIRSIRELATLNYFNPETISPEPRPVNDSTVDIVYKLEERSSDTFNASVGYSGTYGVTGAIGLTFNNFDITAPFTGGGGQVLNLDWQFGEASRFRIFSINFTEPWFMDTPTSLGFSLFDERQQYYYDLRRTGISGNIGRRFRWPDDYFRGDWFVRFLRYDVRNGGILYDTGVRSEVSITQVISRNSLDSPIFPSSGTRFSLTTTISGGILPGESDYQKHNLSLDWFTPLLKIKEQNRLTLYTGAEFGLLKGFSEDSYIPPIEYYFMGGNGLQIQTLPLRGYEDRSIGPRERGIVRGGSVFSRYVMELRFAVTLNPMPIYVLAFADGGNTWLDLQHADPFDLKKSAGFGARILIMGVGLIGFDYGYGFDDVDPLDGKPDGWHFHFQFGRGF